MANPNNPHTPTLSGDFDFWDRGSVISPKMLIGEPLVCVNCLLVFFFRFRYN